ncbi:uncharacterized protein LOC143074121 [Mytilus galloprovincialis]|uniref:uncharacterized protein LOC143074121 n=1 Tax=Mytilus galloprovincialis TaxID=29158 RepID=UPI003F7B37A2
MIDGNDTVRLTSREDDHNQDLNLVITDKQGMILLDGTYVKRRCFPKVLNIYSPAGFFLGSVREKHLKYKADFEIHGANQNLLFLVTIENDATHFSIEITLSNDGQKIAQVSSSPMENGKLLC